MTKQKGYSFMRNWLPVLLTMLICSAGFAQTNNSPYSIHAIGDITENIVNRTTGLSSTGIAYRNQRNLIINNPASLSGLDNQFFVGEIGVNAKYVNYSGNPVSPTNHGSSDITFKRVSLGTKIFRNWGSAVGIMPYSEENYEYTSNRQVGYSGLTIPSYDQGYGGINKVFWANGYDFFHHLSIGVTAAYLFGSINNKSILSSPGTSIYISKNNSTFYSGLHLDYGLQFHGSINQHFDITIGAVYSNQQDLNADQTVTVFNIDSTVIRSKSSSGTYTIPTSYGWGFSITKDKKYTLLFDYKFQDWSALHTSTGDYFYENSHRTSVGFEISNKKNIFNNLYETSFFQAGVFYNTTYLMVNSTPIEDIGGSLAFGVNSKRSPLAFTLALTYGIKGTTNNNLLRENYMTASFIFNFRDFWYTKGRRFN